MGKTLKYVSEFTFPSDKGYSASAGKTMVKGYARGGAADIKQDKTMVKEAVQKHERARHPGEPMTKLAEGGMAECNMAKGGMAMRGPPKAPSAALDQVKQAALQNPQGMTRSQGQRAAERAQMDAARAAGNDPATAMARAREASRIQSQTRGSIQEAMARARNANTPVSPLSAPVGMGVNQRVGIAMAKGGMAMRKRYPADRKEPLITRTKAPAAPAPKSDMLYSKKEVNATNLLSEGKAPALPHARGSVNMAKGGMTPKQQAKVGKVMGEFKAGELHSGKDGPVVKNRKQAIAIGLSEARKAKK